MIISVGYRVNAKRGVQFRRWANKVLKEYLVKGYAVNDRLRRDQLGELRQLVQVVGRTLQFQDVTATTDGQALFDVVVDYTYALDTLDNYDYERLSIEQTTAPEAPFHATYENAMAEIRRLHNKFGGSQWFGNEKDDSFKSSIGQIYQTFGGEELYPSVEEKAAMLLYLVTKNHSFSDGNKRIAATLFLWFLNNNGILYRPDGTKRIAANLLGRRYLGIDQEEDFLQLSKERKTEIDNVATFSLYRKKIKDIALYEKHSSATLFSEETQGYDLPF